MSSCTKKLQFQWLLINLLWSINCQSGLREDEGKILGYFN